MFTELFYIYKKMFQDKTVPLIWKADLIRLQPFRFGSLARIFSDEPDIIDRWYNIKTYGPQSRVRKFLKCVELFESSSKVNLQIINFNLEYPDINIEDAYFYLLLKGKTKVKIRTIYKYDKETIEKIFPEIKDWLNNNFKDLWLRI